PATAGLFHLMQADSKNIAIVCNPLAGAGRAVALAGKIRSVLSDKQISYSLFKETWPPDFNGFTDVWIVGGDGTLNYFVNQYPDINQPLVIFNGGTGNDFHWLLYGNNSFEEQIQLTLSAIPKPIDLGRCNEKFFINGIGIGFEGEVAKSLTGKKKKAGKASFMAMILRKIFSYRSKIYRVITDTKPVASKKYMIIDISNGSRAGGGFHIAPQAKADDGLFDIVLIDALRPLNRLRWLPVIEKGKHLGLPFIHHFRAKKISIESEDIIQFHLDGEYDAVKKLEVDLMPGKLLFRY
ncbi:MAG: diacylglycerol kinase family protein, partial [Chitinophagaceae bacterium]